MFIIFKVDISAPVAYVMAYKEDSELNHIKVRQILNYYKMARILCLFTTDPTLLLF